MLNNHNPFSYHHIGSVDIEEIESIITKIQISMNSNLHTEMLDELKLKIRKYAHCYIFYSKEHNAFILEPWGEIDDA